MSSAFCDPPDSGVKASANADGAAIRIARAAAEKAATSRRLGVPVGKAAGSYPRPSGRSYFVPDGTQRGSDPLERGVPLLHEGGHALLEVLRPGQGVLELGLEVELAVEVRVQHPVERLLGARV